MSDLDRKADDLLDYCRAKNIEPTRENLELAHSEMNEYADRLVEFCRAHGVPPTEFNLRMALGVLCALARNRTEENDAT